MPLSVNGANGITFSDGSIQNTGAVGFGFKNRIINGDMRIDQRNGGGSITPASGVTYTVDRWHLNLAQSSKVSAQRNAGSVTPPDGFTNYIGLTSQSAYSVLTGDYHTLRQSIEGYNVSDLNWGSANAKTATLSFWVRSSLTGTFGGSINNSNYSRSYPYTYTINTANTWEYKTVVIPGDTSGTWQTNDYAGIHIGFGLGTGSTYLGAAGSWSGNLWLGATGQTNLLGTNGATFYITGVQFEKGSTATAFDPRPYSYELQLCQRYYSQLVGNYTPDFIIPNSSYVNYFTHCWQFPQTMRAAPTVSQISGTTVTMDQFGIGPATVSSNQIGSVNQYYVRLTVLTSSPSSAAPGTAISATGTFWQASAEL